MKRLHLTFLSQWLKSPSRKPLIIRGARQVGKTWLIRELARVNQRKLFEINLEKNPQYASLFSTNDVNQILLNLQAIFNQTIQPGNSILFMDEIQAAPELLAKLRWFYEDLPQLPVVAAGSLLEFALEKHQFSMPVGRIQYAHLEPLSFEEFLLAKEKALLLEFLKTYKIKNNELPEIPQALQMELIALFKEYLIVGGLPAAVSSWVQEKSFLGVNQIHSDLFSTYRDDFAKYNGRINISDLDKVLMAVPQMLGQKFVYSHIAASIATVRKALELLNKAKICHRVQASSGNGVPLGSQVKEKWFKQIFLDVGLVSTALGLNLNHLNKENEINLINQGALAEQVAGQLLRTISLPFVEPNLYYWLREEKGSNAEVDYLLEHGNQIVPVEIKAGTSGTLKSLHLFMGSKNAKLAIRINSDFPTLTLVKVKDSLGKEVSYRLLSLPFYMISEIHRLIDELQSIN